MPSRPYFVPPLAPVLLTSLLAFIVPALSGQSSVLKARDYSSRRIVLDIVARPSLQAVTSALVFDNGARVPTDKLSLLTPADASEAPAQLVLVIDAVNSSLQDLVRGEDAVQAILKASRGPLPQPTSVVILSDTAGHSAGKSATKDSTTLHQRELFAHRIPASRDAAAISDQLNSYKLGLHRILQAQAGPGQAERVQLSLEALSFIAKAEASEPGAKVLVWVGNGWPFLSKSNARSSEQLFDSIVYFSDLLRSARIILYSVSPEGVTSQDHSAETEGFLLSSRPGSIQANGYAPNIPVELTPDYYKQFLKGVHDPAQSNPNDLALQVLAYNSGGLVLQQNNDLKSQILQCISDTQYISSLSYDPETKGGMTVFHEITVKRSGDNQLLRTQAGFYTR